MNLKFEFEFDCFLLAVVLFDRMGGFRQGTSYWRLMVKDS